MELMILSKECVKDQINSIGYHTKMHDTTLQIQGKKVDLKCNMYVGFIYCRSTPSNEDIQFLNDMFADCKILLGDFNLSHRIKSEQRKLQTVCGDSRESILNEVTRAISNNQIDYVIVDKVLKSQCFASSYYNFISDHKSITLRIGLNLNKLSEETLKNHFKFKGEKSFG